jgi:hypothetical protein
MRNFGVELDRFVVVGDCAVVVTFGLIGVASVIEGNGKFGSSRITSL